MWLYFMKRSVSSVVSASIVEDSDQHDRVT